MRSRAIPGKDPDVNPLPDPFAVEVHSQAPVRISFAGGGTDVSPFPELYGGMVVNATISTFMRATLRLRHDSRIVIRANTRPEPIEYPSLRDMRFDRRLDFVKAIAKAMYRREEGFELWLHSAVRMRSGLGGSGAMCVAVQGVFNHLLGDDRLDAYELAELAYSTETIALRNASGRQDQYAAALGGINHIVFEKDRVEVHPVEIDGERLERLKDSILLLWLGERPAASGGIIEEQTRGVQTGGEVLEAMKRTKQRVLDMRDAVRDADWRRIGELLDVLWEHKKRFSAKISNPWIDSVYARMKRVGMIGGKVTGAGGGGHMMACCDPRDRQRVVAAAEAMGVRVVPFDFVFSGVRTWVTPRPAAEAPGEYVPAEPQPWATRGTLESPPAGGVANRDVLRSGDPGGAE